MHFHVETLLSEPVIAAVKTESALTAALASPCSTIFLLASTLVNVEGMVQRIRQAGQLELGKPDFVEILPGILPRIITEISTQTPVPIIAGGLLRDKADVIAAMRAGAAAVSTSAPSLMWWFGQRSESSRKIGWTVKRF